MPWWADPMGFDPRDSGRQPSRGVVTSNVDTLLAENDALRREVRRLRQRLQDLHRPGEQRSRPPAPEPVRYGITATQVERWGLAMARHPRWQELRVGPPGGLRGLVEERRRRSWNPQLSLEEDLERRCPGLGVELAQALRGPHSRVRWAVRAAFALYGPSALEWLADEPLRVVEGLLGPGQQRERRPPEVGSSAAGEPAPATSPTAVRQPSPRRPPRIHGSGPWPCWVWSRMPAWRRSSGPTGGWPSSITPTWEGMWVCFTVSMRPTGC